jgi:hypothetical protein
MAQGRTAQASGKIMAMQELSVNSVRIEEDGGKVRRSRHHEQDMAVQYARFISVKGDLVGKSIFCR